MIFPRLTLYKETGLCSMGTSPLVDCSMQARSLPYFLLGLLIVVGWMLAACTTDQLATKEKKPTGPLTAEERSRREQEARVLESSWYECSDYHTQKDGEGGIDVGAWMRTRKEMKAQQEETEKRLAKLEKKAGKQQAA